LIYFYFQVNSNQIRDDLKLTSQRHLAKSCNCIVLNEAIGTKSISSSDTEDSSDDSKLKTKSRSSRNLVTPPDGGWGWIIVFISFMINLIADGITASFGLVFIVLTDYFKQSKSKTAWVGSLFISMPLLTGPLASALTDRYGCRRVTIVSGLLAASGFMLGYFATRLEHLFLAFSISGFGLSLCFVTSIVIVAYYFEKRRSLSTGLAVCGTGVGACLFAPFTTYLLKNFSWRGTLLIFSGFFLNIIVFGAFMRDLEVNEESAVTLSECDYSAQTNQKLPINNNKSLLPNLSSFLLKYRNFSSLVDIPTFIRNDSSFKVINTSCDATKPKSHDFKEVDPLDSQNKKECINSLQKETDESTLVQQPQLESQTNIQKRKDLKTSQTNKRAAKRRKHMNFQYSLDQHEMPVNAASKRQSRVSITYRNAMLSMRPCMASSAPDLYHRTSISKRKFENVRQSIHWYQNFILANLFIIYFLTGQKYMERV
jgi:monocarboxylate transporter, putative (fragment)